ncbi:MAG: zincin-like metallopeptidase domain-containing protein [Isosphaeraceae bacterium]
MAAARFRLTSKWWATFNQWKQLGGRVMLCPAHVPAPAGVGTASSSSPGHQGRDQRLGRGRRGPLLRHAFLHRLQRRSGRGHHLDHLRAGRAEDDTTGPVIDYEPAEEAIAATGIAIRHGGGRAFYSPSGDFVQVPPKASFTEPDEYYETVFHELVHATEHPTRLDWSRKEAENSYAMGELVAEIGACYLARELGVPASENLTNHVAYLANWLKAMRDDPRFIFTASAQASKAADYLLAFSRPQATEADEPEAALAR